LAISEELQNPAASSLVAERKDEEPMKQSAQRPFQPRKQYTPYIDFAKQQQMNREKTVLMQKEAA
jgi:hypothetical protein